MQLYRHQDKLDNDITEAFKNHRYVLAVSPTGSGKTVNFSKRLADCKGMSAAIAHRSELLGQMSFALARFGVRHRVIAPSALVKQINQMHLMKLRKSFYDPNAKCAVVSVQTLLSQFDALKGWGRQVTDWVTDEAHHLVKSNMWGKGVELFPNARGLGVTAHSGRADGKGLGRGNQIITKVDEYGNPLEWSYDGDGIFEVLVRGPYMRDLIDAGFLADYKIYAPPSDLDMEGAKVGDSGDWSQPEVTKRVRASHIIGDVVDNYLKIAPGKLGICFAPDIETANDIALRLQGAGIPAAAISSKTPVLERAALLGRFERRELLILVNVDLFGEGYDLPALEVVIFARPTMSFQLYLQQFGRVLRTFPGKTHGIIIDHVGNVERFSHTYGLPDSFREETLDRRGRGSKQQKSPDAIPQTRCLNLQCMRTYERIYAACPHCGHKPEPAKGRSRPEFVDGDLFEMDPAVLEQMRGAILQQSAPPAIPYGAPGYVADGIRNRHWEKCQSQAELRDTIAWWAGYRRNRGYNDSQSYRAFYFHFGMDVYTAQTLNRADSEELTKRIKENIEKLK